MSLEAGARLSMRGWARRIFVDSRRGPVVTILLALLAIWYAAAVAANWTGVRDGMVRADVVPDAASVLVGTMSSARPIVPAPHQIALEMWSEIVDEPPTSPRSILFHAVVTLQSALLGFALGACAGALLAAAIVHSRTLRLSVMPWIISSQMIPILALAPIVIVVLGSIGVKGLLPKAMISAFLCFFPVTIGAVKGLQSPEPLQRDLLRTYSASAMQTMRRLRIPAATPFLLASLKIAASASVVGAIVAELPTGAQAGLGARLLAGSYRGQTVQMWTALTMAAFVSACLVSLVAVAERAVARRQGLAT
jgi:NitT/TauT family transport system permease protein